MIIQRSQKIFNASGADRLYVTAPDLRFYLTGFSSSDGCVVTDGEGTAFYTDARYLEAAAAALKGSGIAVKQAPKGGYSVLAEGAGTLAVSLSRMAAAEYLELTKRAGKIADCTQATYPDCPWVPESLRKAKVKKLNDTAAVASVTTPAGITSWLALQKRGDEWVVVGQAALEDTARKYALGTAARPERDGGAPSGQGRGQEGVNI